MKRLHIILFYIFIASGISAAFAQETNGSNTKFRKAIEEAQKTLATDPSRGDLMVVIANNYAWQEKSDSALVYIEKAKQINYYNDDLFDSWLNVLLWAHKYDNLLDACGVAGQYKY